MRVIGVVSVVRLVESKNSAIGGHPHLAHHTHKPTTLTMYTTLTIATKR